MSIRFSPFPQLLTERLFLRRLSLKDDEEIFALRSNDVVNKYIVRPRPVSIEDARAFIRKINTGISADEWVYWAICLRGHVKLIGTICLWNFSDDEGKAEIGYELHPDHHGKGIMQEAFLKVIEFAFQTLQLDSIEAWTIKQNSKSVRVLERNHFKRDFDAENKVNRSIEGADRVIYSLLKTDYLKVCNA